jgi:hypothetical protein
MAKRPLTESEQAILDRLHPVHREAIGRYQVAQEAIITKLRKERTRRPVGIIHHYTKPNVFPLILQSGVLFLSDYSKMIDTSEIEYGFNTGMEVLRYELAEGWKTGRAKLLVWMMEQIAKEGLGKYLRGYVGCLSKAEDNLPQWREYGGGETGFCLSFDEQELDKAFEAFKVGKAIYSGGGFEVIYDDARLRRIMKQYVDSPADTPCLEDLGLQWIRAPSRLLIPPGQHRRLGLMRGRRRAHPFHNHRDLIGNPLGDGKGGTRESHDNCDHHVLGRLNKELTVPTFPTNPEIGHKGAPESPVAFHPAAELRLPRRSAALKPLRYTVSFTTPGPHPARAVYGTCSIDQTTGCG